MLIKNTLIFSAAKASMHGYYVQVYCRYGPYVMGVLLGYYLHHKELRQEESPRLVRKKD